MPKKTGQAQLPKGASPDSIRATHKLKMHMKKRRNKASYEGNVGCMSSVEKAYFVPASMNRRTLKVAFNYRGVPKATIEPHKHALEINRRLTRGY